MFYQYQCQETLCYTLIVASHQLFHCRDTAFIYWLLLLGETQSSGRLIETRCQTVLTVLERSSTSGWG